MCCLFKILWATITAFLPAAFPCQPIVCNSRSPAQSNDIGSTFVDTDSPPGTDTAAASRLRCPANPDRYSIDVGVLQYWCREPVRVNETIIDGEYNEGSEQIIMTHLPIYLYLTN